MKLQTPNSVKIRKMLGDVQGTNTRDCTWTYSKNRQSQVDTDAKNRQL